MSQHNIIINGNANVQVGNGNVQHVGGGALVSPLFLFDVSAYLHRAMHVVYGDRVSTVDTSDTTFIKQASIMVSNTMRECNVQRMILVEDSLEPSWRCDDYPAYKANRREHYPVFTEQVPRFFDAMEKVGVKTLWEERYEADDLIGSIVGHADMVIVSSDKDMFTHVGPRVQYYDPMKKKWIRVSDVMEKLGGLSPEQFPDFIGLVGDAIDGIPGVPGFGPKTAAKLLLKFGTLDEIYAADRRGEVEKALSAKQIANLFEHQNDALMSRRLAVPCIWPGAREYLSQGNMDAPDVYAVRAACEGL